MPVLLACAIEDSTDIFGISGGELNTPNPPLGMPLCETKIPTSLEFKPQCQRWTEFAIYRPIDLSIKLMAKIDFHPNTRSNKSVPSSSSRVSQDPLLHNTAQSHIHSHLMDSVQVWCGAQSVTLT